MLQLDPTTASFVFGATGLATGLAAVAMMARDRRRASAHAGDWRRWSAADLDALTAPEPRLVGRALDVAAVLVVVLTLGAIGFVGLHPIASRHPDIGKITLRVIGQGGAVAEARR